MCPEIIFCKMVCGGGQLAVRPHLLSKDGKQLFICVGHSVRVYSAVTAELLLELQSHTDEVTSLALHPTIPSQVYSASLDGCIILWDALDGSLVQSHLVGEPIESFALVGDCAYVSTHWADRQAGRITAFDLRTGKLMAERAKTSSPRAIVPSSSGRFIAAIERHSVLVWSTEKFSKKPLVLHHTRPLSCVAISPDDARVAAGDASGRIVIWHDLAAAAATASSGGQRGRAEAEESGVAAGGEGTAGGAAGVSSGPLPAATVHWHAHAVGCVAFSVDGMHLLSGGQEAVLVMWDAATGRRTYLPRLGGALVGLATCQQNPAVYAVRQGDNTIRMVNMATMRVECSLHGLRPPPATSASAPAAPAAVAVQPSTGHLVVAGPHGMLQFYDALRDAHVDRLQVSPRNLTSLTESDAVAMGGGYGPPLEPSATCVAFSCDAKVMVTVEVRPDLASSATAMAGDGAAAATLYSLKFWDRRLKGVQYGQQYVLNTLADQPHRCAAGNGNVTSLSYHPTDHVVCTTSGSGAEFRVWTRQQVAGTAGAAAGDTWRCQAVGSYRGEAMHASAFSGDGSLLAVAVGARVTLWDTYRTCLLAVLPSPAADAAPITRLAFLSGSPLLVAASGSHLTLFNLLTTRVEYCHPLPITSLAADPSSPHFAVLLTSPAAQPLSPVAAAPNDPPAVPSCKGGSLLVFKEGGREPVGGWALRRPATAAAAVVFAPPGTPLHGAAAEASLPGMSPLLVISDDRQYQQAVRQGSAVHSPRSPATLRGRADSFATRPPAATPPQVSGLEALYGAQQAQQQHSGVPHPAPLNAAPIGGPAWRALFDAPSHVLPPLSALCPAFLELLISKDGIRADKHSEQ